MKKNLILICLIACMTSGCTCLNEVYVIKQNSKIGFINKDGKEVITPKYEDAILNQKESLIAVKFNGLWGFIDKKGDFKIIPQYKSTNGFINGLAYVTDDNYEGYITPSGEYVWKQPKLKEKIVTKTVNKVVNNTQHHTKAVTTVKNDLADDILKDLGL